jgi:hypothetical protein
MKGIAMRKTIIAFGLMLGLSLSPVLFGADAAKKADGKTCPKAAQQCPKKKSCACDKCRLNKQCRMAKRCQGEQCGRSRMVKLGAETPQKVCPGRMVVVYSSKGAWVHWNTVGVQR